jgi:hypothetical protein
VFNGIALSVLMTGTLAAAPATRPAATQPSFLEAKTFFQTNVGYDPRIGIAVDAVVVHQHGLGLESLKGLISSWQKKGFITGRMFFSDSDAGNAYTTGKWDGKPHPEDIERNAKGEPVLCAGVRPYMTPTEGWIKYLEEMTNTSIDAGAEAVMPEEPLAHIDTGFEESFRKLWQERYGTPWQAENSSPAARYMSGQLKGELYEKLERRLAELTHQRARELGRPIPFVLPIHSAYGCLASNLVAPLGTSLDIPADGYIGQIWTGPIRWTTANYNSPSKTFFGAAYALYDYFVQLADGTGKRLWLLTDPVEDDPNHTWPEFERWYRECVVAELMFPQVTQYEVMPWPDRIFLPGYSMGGQTPAPERFRVIVLSVLQALQEMPAGGQRCDARGRPLQAIPHDIGVAVSDSLMWQLPPRPCMQGIYGLMLPLIDVGVPVKSCILERATEPGYLSRFKTIVASFEVSQPPSAAASKALVEWTRGGGMLVIFGSSPELDGPFWWRKAGFKSAREYLFKELGLLAAAEGDHKIGSGHVFVSPISPTAFGDSKVAHDKYLTVLEQPLRATGAFCLRRGPFVVVHASARPVKLTGSYVDLFEPELPVVNSPEVARGASRLYRALPDAPAPLTLLHATHRVMSAERQGDGLRVVVRGPTETPAVLRLQAGEQQYQVAAHNADGKEVPADVVSEGGTIRVRLANDPQGVTIVISPR